jgi:hypothetical protein
MAWARSMDDNYGGDDNYENAVGLWRGSLGSSGSNDNYGGGDDNYPTMVVKMERSDERKDVAGTGRNSCR